MSAILAYFQGSLEELRLVQWPTRQQAVRLSVIVLVFILLTSVFFGLIDALFTEVIRVTLP